MDESEIPDLTPEELASLVEFFAIIAEIIQREGL